MHTPSVLQILREKQWARLGFVIKEMKYESSERDMVMIRADGGIIESELSRFSYAVTCE